MKKVVLTAPLPAEMATLVGPDLRIVSPPGRLASRSELLAELADAFALVAVPSFVVDESLLAHAPALRLVACYSVGHDHVDLAACGRRAVLVTNTPDVLTEATADLTFALLLGLARHVVWGDATVRADGWLGFEPCFGLGVELAGQTLGIVGLGRIGAAVARRARAFGLEIVYSGPHAKAALEEALPARRLPLDALLAEADVVTLHCALGPATRHLLSAERIGRMRPTALLVNTARGALVDEEALCQALHEDRLAGAALDVFEGEPLLSAALRAAPRTLFAPHLGSATAATRRRMAELCAGAIREAAQGRSVPHALNPEVTSRW